MLKLIFIIVNREKLSIPTRYFLSRESIYFYIILFINMLTLISESQFLYCIQDNYKYHSADMKMYINNSKKLFISA